jgi:hypothetical protein
LFVPIQALLPPEDDDKDGEVGETLLLTTAAENGFGLDPPFAWPNSKENVPYVEVCFCMLALGLSEFNADP